MTALNPEALEAVARAIEPEVFQLPKIELYRANYERAFARARAAIEAYHASEPDAVAVAVAAERNACAKWVEGLADVVGRITAAGWRGNPNMSGDDRDFMHAGQRRHHDAAATAVVEHIAAAIRARSQP